MHPELSKASKASVDAYSLPIVSTPSDRFTYQDQNYGSEQIIRITILADRIEIPLTSILISLL